MRILSQQIPSDHSTIRLHTLTRKTYRYQQYYKGIEVTGKGYALIVDDGVPNGPYFRKVGNGPPVGPVSCSVIAGISPNTFTFSKDVNVKPTLSFKEVTALANKSYGPYEISADAPAKLLFTFTSADPCIPRLAYEANVFDGEEYKMVRLDAKTGELLEEASKHAHLTAPVLDYGGFARTVNLVDSDNFAGNRQLVTQDGVVSTHDFGAGVVDGFNVRGSYTNAMIPTTANANWTTETSAHGFQTHFTVSENVAAFRDIGVNFNRVFAGFTTDFLQVNARAWGNSNPTQNTFIEFSTTEFGNSFALHDVAGHELGHAIISPFIGDQTDIETGSLHESIADMFGVITEAQIQGGVTDWVMGDDNFIISALVDRDLGNRNFECFFDVANLPFGNGNQYVRGDPLTHWFFTIVTGGDPGDDVTPIDIDIVTPILLGALALLNADSDIGEFSDAVLMLSELEFGLCSRNYQSMINAFRHVCIPTPEPCYQIVGGNRVICADRTPVIVCADGYGQDLSYRWTFPIEWDVTGASGNSYEGRCLIVNDIPTYSSYPATFVIRLYALSRGVEFIQERRVTITDCEGEYPGGCPGLVSPLAPYDQGFASNAGYHNKSFEVADEDCTDCNISIFTLLGQKIFEGPYAKYTNFRSTNITTGVYLSAMTSNDGSIIEVKKIFIP
jgi:hypothetical protein